MIISESHRFVFLHNPKCGGMTIRKSLEAYDTTDDLFWGPIQFAGKSSSKEHLPLNLFRRLFPHYFELMAKYFVFVIVRDPYSRMVSGFNQIGLKDHVTDLAKSDDPAKVAQYRKMLNDFVTGLDDRAVLGYSIENRHFVRQRDLIYLEEKCWADLILRQEEWDRSLEKLAMFRPDVAAAIGSHRRMNVRAVPEPKESYLEPRSIARINSLYADDFKLFDYPMITPA